MPHITINDRSMHYLDVGNGQPILFGHSYLWDRRMWQPQVEALSEHYRCIVPELWGHGESDDVPEGELSIASLAANHYTLMQSLGLEQFSVVGLSVGGMWAARLAMDHPEAVKQLVLMDCFMGEEPELSRQTYFGMLSTVEKLGMIPPPMIESLLPLFLSPQTLQKQPWIAEQFSAGLEAISPEKMPSVVALGRAIFSRTDMLDELSALSMPVLVMCGEDDRPRPPHEAREMASRISGARLSIIGGAGHIPSVEQASSVTEHLKTFLDEGTAAHSSAVMVADNGQGLAG